MSDREQVWAEAMRAGNRGDDVAYAGLLEEIAQVLRGVVRRRLGQLGLGVDEAEDVVQEALIGIHLKRATWDEARPILPWVHAIARYKMLDAARRLGRTRRRHVATPVEDWAEILAAPPTGPEISAAEVARLIGELPARQQEVVRALTVEGGTVREVADRYDMSEGAVRVALHRGLSRLKQMAREAEAGLARPGE
ncbi:MAG: sigma-70 family RNA polymerase sigma factor [Rubrimonas sp.]|uniref:sigma-70 family RNA polymerase sigma factor n=1 Tax=Rubrimonas sp. TaxID=2036015 RepID=UPI002FDCC02D